jgi:hypothetical protein
VVGRVFISAMYSLGPYQGQKKKRDQPFLVGIVLYYHVVDPYTTSSENEKRPYKPKKCSLPTKEIASTPVLSSPCHTTKDRDVIQEFDAGSVRQRCDGTVTNVLRLVGKNHSMIEH